MEIDFQALYRELVNTTRLLIEEKVRIQNELDKTIREQNKILAYVREVETENLNLRKRISELENDIYNLKCRDLNSNAIDFVNEIRIMVKRFNDRTKES